MQRLFHTYVLASPRNGALYVGSTDDLAKRVFDHKTKVREWRRGWKLQLIERRNPDWRDLYDDLNNLLGFR